MAAQNYTITVGKARDLQITVKSKGVVIHPPLDVISSNPSIATVQKQGVQYGLSSVRGIAEGAATIKRIATTSGGQFEEDDIEATVVDAPDEMIAVYGAEA